MPRKLTESAKKLREWKKRPEERVENIPDEIKRATIEFFTVVG